jgi:hypothetical protein
MEEANSIIGSLFGAGIETVGILSAGFTFICSRLKPRASNIRGPPVNVNKRNNSIDKCLVPGNDISI